jgi:Sugar (and other) transporter
LPSEVFPVSVRTTGHGIAAGVGKLGAFLGVFFVPQLENHFGLRGMLTVSGSAAILGFALTRVLPEPARRNLEDMEVDQPAPIASSPQLLGAAVDLQPILNRSEPPPHRAHADARSDPAAAPSRATG